MNQNGINMNNEDETKFKTLVDTYFYHGTQGFFRRLLNIKPDYNFYKHTFPLWDMEVQRIKKNLRLHNELGLDNLMRDEYKRLTDDKEIRRFREFKNKKEI